MGNVIGIIGCGNMGGAIASGLASRLGAPWSFAVCSRTPDKARRLLADNVSFAEDPLELAGKSNIIVLAVKPYQIEDVLVGIQPALAVGKVVVSVAAGVSLAVLERLAQNAACVRCMPTTTALAGHGIFAFCFGSRCDASIRGHIQEIFSHIGMCLELPESRFADFSALVGAGPAYVYEFMQGLEQAGTTLGFSREQSRGMLVQLMVGCGKLAEMAEKDFHRLRDDVCSPGGLTIAGINELDRAGFVGLIVDAVMAAAARGHEMEAGQ